MAGFNRNQIRMKVMEVRAVITACGEVQRVGYRDVVERAARKTKITGFVENIKPYDVRIEGDNASIESFISLIRIKEYPIDVEHLDIRFGDATDEFEYFEIKRGDMTDELGERLDIARAQMKKMTRKQDVMIEILDNNTSILKENTSILKDFKNETK